MAHPARTASLATPAKTDFPVQLDHQAIPAQLEHPAVQVPKALLVLQATMALLVRTAIPVDLAPLVHKDLREPLAIPVLPVKMASLTAVIKVVMAVVTLAVTVELLMASLTDQFTPPPLCLFIALPLCPLVTTVKFIDDNITIISFLSFHNQKNFQKIPSLFTPI